MESEKETKVSTGSRVTTKIPNSVSKDEFKTPVLLTKAILDQQNSQVTDCLLNNWTGLALGVAGGIYFGIRRRNIANFLIFVSAGGAGDFAYGYKYSCKDLITNYEATKKALLESEITEAKK